MTLITFDVERDWRARELSKEEMERRRGPDFPYSKEPEFYMIKKAVPELLKLLSKHESDAIFFVTGETARHEPSLVKKIADCSTIGVHTHPYHHKEFRGDHPNEADKDRLADYPPKLIKKMVQRDIEELRNIGVEPEIFRSGKLSIDLEALKVIKKLGLSDSSIELIGFTNFSNLFLYNNIRGYLKETPVTLNPSYVHDNSRLYPLHHIFRGCLILHPAVFGNENIPKEERDEWFKRLESFLENKSSSTSKH